MKQDEKTVGIGFPMAAPKKPERAEVCSFGSPSPTWHSDSGHPTLRDGWPVKGFFSDIKARQSKGTSGSSAANFNFNNGKRNSNDRSNSNNNRALPVRVGK